MPQLDPTWFASQLFWLAITFVTLYIMLSRLVLPPLQEVIARRKQTIEGDIAQAQRLKSQAEQARQEYERTLAEARLSAQKLIDDAMLEQKAGAEQQGKAMDKQIEQQLAEATRKIAARKKELIEALTPTTAELTAIIVEKLTQQLRPAASRSAASVNQPKGKSVMNEMLEDPRLWVAAAFVLFVAFGYKKIGGAIARALDERSAKIKAELDEARRLREEAERCWRNINRSRPNI